MTRNLRFLHELGAKAKKEDVILLLRRSGKRSADAAEAATEAGFANAFNVLEGIEGEQDERRRRGMLGGWRFHGIPWVRD